MNKCESRLLSLACVLFLLGTAGCQTGENNGATLSGNIKSQGVYTTLAISDPGLELPASGYLAKNSFNPGEMPAAVVTGYGSYNQQQMISLQLIESGTGRSLLSKDCYASYGKVVMLPLPIRLSGSYKVKISAGSIELDSCEFTVVRTNRSGAVGVDGANTGASYGQGNFSVSTETAGPLNLPDDYDEKLIYKILYSVRKEADAADPDLFAQRFPGKIVVQCRLDFDGRVSEPNLTENTLDEDCAELFQRALLKQSPYGAWGDDARRKLGADHLDIKLTFHFD